MIYVKNQDNLVAFRRGPRLRNPPRWECAEDTGDGTWPGR